MLDKHMARPRYTKCTRTQYWEAEAKYFWKTFVTKESNHCDSALRQQLTIDYNAFKAKVEKAKAGGKSFNDSDVELLLGIAKPENPKPENPKPENPNVVALEKHLDSFTYEKPDPEDPFVNRYPSVPGRIPDGKEIIEWFECIWSTNRRETILKYLSRQQAQELEDHMYAIRGSISGRESHATAETEYIWNTWLNPASYQYDDGLFLRIYDEFRVYEHSYDAYYFKPKDHEDSKKQVPIPQVMNNEKPDPDDPFVNKYPSVVNVALSEDHGLHPLSWFRWVWTVDRRETILKYLSWKQVKELEKHMDMVGEHRGKISWIREEVRYIWTTWVNVYSICYDADLYKIIHADFNEYVKNHCGEDEEDEYNEGPTPRVIQGSFAKHSYALKKDAKAHDFEDDVIETSGDDEPTIQRIQQAIEAAGPKPNEEDFGSRYEIGDRLALSFASLQPGGMPEPEVEEPDDEIEAGDVHECFEIPDAEKPATRNLFGMSNPLVDDEEDVGEDEDMVFVYVPPKKPAAASSPQPKRMPDPEPNEPVYDPDKLTEKERSMLCHSCQERYIRTIIYPCEHMILCVTCAVAWDKKNPNKPTCPSCRTAYTRISKPFFG
jgi:hypothetical protein